MRVGCEGGTAAWVVGTLAPPNVQVHGLPQPRSYGLSESLFKLLVAGDKKASLASFS